MNSFSENTRYLQNIQNENEIDLNFPFVIREYSEKYRALIPFYRRLNLTVEEIAEIGNYQDVHPWRLQKKDWSIQIPKNWSDKTYCYVINSSCRFDDFFKSLSDAEQALVSKSIQNIDSAVRKSRVPVNQFIYRGVYDIDWISNPSAYTVFKDAGFNSFSLELENACRYVNPVKPILFRLYLVSGMSALFIDSSEFEVLRPRNVSYKIIEISKQYVPLNKEANINKEALIFTIEENRT
ncbi:MAG: ADP-ribosyltransferase [Methanosarcinales archaeon]|jgi:hypothetical protein|nr:ADP-ribosyltransferase [Methanosarcinales archaeon]